MVTTDQTKTVNQDGGTVAKWDRRLTDDEVLTLLRAIAADCVLTAREKFPGK